MRAEYSEKQRHVLLGEGDWFRTDPPWIPVEDELSNYEQLKGMQPPPHAEKRTLRPTSREPQHMSKGDRLAGPYIWHVKDLIAQR